MGVNLLRKDHVFNNRQPVDQQKPFYSRWLWYVVGGSGGWRSFGNRVLGMGMHCSSQLLGGPASLCMYPLSLVVRLIVYSFLLLGRLYRGCSVIHWVYIIGRLSRSLDVYHWSYISFFGCTSLGVYHSLDVYRGFLGLHWIHILDLLSNWTLITDIAYYPGRYRPLSNGCFVSPPRMQSVILVLVMQTITMNHPLLQSISISAACRYRTARLCSSHLQYDRCQGPRGDPHYKVGYIGNHHHDRWRYPGGCIW